MAEITATIRDTQGNAKVGWTVQVRLSNGTTIISTTEDGTMSDQGNGSYVTTNSPPAQTYDIYACASGGTPTLVKGYDNFRHLEYPLPETMGGTGFTSLQNLPAEIGLEIGADVQAHSTRLDTIVASIEALNLVNADGLAVYDQANDTAAFATAASARTVLGLTDSNASRQLLGVEIGVDVQAHSAFLDDVATAMDAAAEDKVLGVSSGSGTAWTGTEARTILGLGTSATIDSTTSGEANKMVKVSSKGSITIPLSNATISADASTLGHTFQVLTGNATTGTFIVKTVVITGESGGNYTYGFHEIYSSSWGGAQPSNN